MPDTKHTIHRKTVSQRVGLWTGVILSLSVLLFFDFTPANPQTTRMAAVALLMAIWWITDAIPLYATALLPMLLYPLLGIMKGNDVAPVYINSTIFLFIGGFILALTMQKWNLHRRIALYIIRLIGGGPDRIILGFMAAAAFLSMWISNTATAIMMVPIALAIIIQMEEEFSKQEVHHFTVSLMLGIAYACSLGGIATLVGTPPNLVFARIFSILFPDATAISFGSWFMMAVPLTLIMILVVWLLLTRLFFKVPAEIKVDRSVIESEYRGLGRMSFEEKIVLVFFTITAFLWVFRKDLVLGSLTIPGWSQLLPYPEMIDDGTVALFMSLLLFFIPARSEGATSATVGGPGVIKRIPWNIVLLFGGGFALASGFQQSGLASLIGNQFSGLVGISPMAMIVSVCSGLTFLTELTSNTATTNMILPILASVATELRINPLLILVPATLSASFAFMMPVATPPNAIIFGSGRVKIIEMARTGFFINIIGIIVVSTYFFFIGSYLLGIEAGQFPEWAKEVNAGIN
ncbi:MAG: DASS family sodium-coupled anion symporter [Candidatus Marinimicrobia bacterium]|nr:DASS family sodium-coupled anion symporter [Candidatus Neomarinimicrobiota bacterium]MCF7850381.1 DASS family sodium-coupled anion symporter [Candidatus Neomarinimicrobiota bacterium]MCF7904983.1 DASS family sodium-coupled anion symporter [Candidatus Neomarinimicrobiota bacterium]